MEKLTRPISPIKAFLLEEFFQNDAKRRSYKQLRSADKCASQKNADDVFGKRLCWEQRWDADTKAACKE